MQAIEIHEKKVDVAVFQFLFPFSFKEGSEQTIFPFLRQHQFKHFQLDHLEDENQYYGDFHISHLDLEAYYLPFTNKILFPADEYQKGIQRYSKSLNLNGRLRTNSIRIPFQVHSIDITLCPYELGFITIRTEVKEQQELSLSMATEFAARFRVLKPRSEREKQTWIECEGHTFNQVEHFVFDHLFDGLTDFFPHKTKENAYFERFSFFEDARMYVQSFVSLKEKEEIELVDLYRSIGLCGLTEQGLPDISANNLSYIEDYIERHSFQRWAPNTYFLMEEHSFLCLTNENVSQLASQIYGEYYYGLLLNLFHKMVLLKIAHAYAEINIDRDTKHMEKLIYSINSFTANYFFSELASQSQGRDIFYLLRKTFNIELLYKDAKETLYSLFKYQENANAKKDSLLLLILTLYSVIGQMLGMNLVINDFVGKVKWHNLLTYNPFEYLALFMAASAILVSLILGIQNIYQWISDQKSRKKWVEQTVLSSKKR